MIKKLPVKDLMFFDNDDQFIDYCLSSAPTIFKDDDGIPYYDYEWIIEDINEIHKISIMLIGSIQVKVLLLEILNH